MKPRPETTYVGASVDARVKELIYFVITMSEYIFK